MDGFSRARRSSNCMLTSCPKKSSGTEFEMADCLSGPFRMPPHTHIPSPCAMLCPLLAINSEAERPLPGSAILKCQEQNKQEQAAGMHSLVTRCIQAGAWKEELRVRMAWERGCLLWKLHLQQKWEQLTQKAASPAWKKNKTSCCFQISYFLHV